MADILQTGISGLDSLISGIQAMVASIPIVGPLVSSLPPPPSLSSMAPPSTGQLELPKLPAFPGLPSTHQAVSHPVPPGGYNPFK